MKIILKYSQLTEDILRDIDEEREKDCFQSHLEAEDALL